MMAPSQIVCGPSVGERQRAATARGFFAGFCPARICPNWGGVGNAVIPRVPDSGPVVPCVSFPRTCSVMMRHAGGAAAEQMRAPPQPPLSESPLDALLDQAEELGVLTVQEIDRLRDSIATGSRNETGHRL